MPATTPEGKVKEQVKQILKKAGAWYYMPVSTGYGKHGCPDFLICFRGRFLAIECKAEDGMHPTALQEIQLKQIEDAGGVTWVVTPSVLPELEKWFKCN